MNFSLEQEYRYIVLTSSSNVRSQLKSILKTPLYDIAINLTGTLSEDDSFKLYPKLTVGAEFFGISRGFAIIAGRLATNGQQTTIEVRVRPSRSVLVVFYVFLISFLIKLFSLVKSSSEADLILVVALFVGVIFFRSLIHFSAGRLRNRFERLMSLYPEE